MQEAAGTNLVALYRLAHALIFCRSRKEALESAARELAAALKIRNAILWTFSAEKGQLVPSATIFADKSLKARAVSRSADFLGETYKSHKPAIHAGEALSQSKHLQSTGGAVLESVLCCPFRSPDDVSGVLEFIRCAGDEGVFSDSQFGWLKEAMELLVAAIRSWKLIEGQTENQLHAITRLTLLYDISQIFHSTLELSELLPIITEKIRDILGAETCTIWFPDDSGEKIRCLFSTGGYAEIFTAWSAPLAEDPAGEAFSSGEGLYIEDASEEERLLKRLPNQEETPVITYMNSPLVYGESVMGVLEVMNRVEGNATFSEEDHFLLNDLAAQAAVSIHNANLLAAERKAKELDALLKVSREITSTLDLNHVLLAVVNQAASLVPFDRACIGLVEGGSIQAGAVSGQMEVDRKKPEIRQLEQTLEWTAGLKKGLYVSELDGKIATEREDVREKFKAHFEASGYRSFVAIPLKDDEGELGILSFESAQPYFLDERHLEVIGILANQVTVAIRNAQLYRQVPLVDLMQPIMKKKSELMKMTRNRKLAWLGGAAAAILLLALFPWNMKVPGEATVLPFFRTQVFARVEGIIGSVRVHEGDAVGKSSELASLVDQDYKLAVEKSLTKRDLLAREISRSESMGDTVTAGLKRIEMDQVVRELAYAREQLERTRIVAPSAGVVVTPHIEETAGRWIRKGEEFCEIANMSEIRAEVSVDEGDIPYLKPGQRIALKMNSYPTMKFYGTVRLLGAEVSGDSKGTRYVLQAGIDDPGHYLKPGMSGQAKIATGNHSVGYVLLRKPVGFLWKKLWVWLP